MLLVVWDISTGSNIEFFSDMDKALDFIKNSGNENYKITSCS